MVTDLFCLKYCSSSELDAMSFNKMKKWHKRILFHEKAEKKKADIETARLKKLGLIK